MADPLHLLLDVQDRDLAADQLRHRRANLPERAALVEQETAIVRLDAELAEIRERLAELQRAQKRLEDEIATVQAKSEAESTKLYSGTVTAARELQAMQEEIAGLSRRQRELEDDLLDLMEAGEPVLGEVHRLEARRAELVEQITALRRAIAEGEAAIDGELAVVAADRDGVAGQVPSDLLATYEKLRQRFGGIAVARLEGTQCLGCHISLPAVELDAVRHSAPDALLFHEECGRILVH